MDQAQVAQIKQTQKDLFERSWDSKEAYAELQAFYASALWQEYVAWRRVRLIDGTAGLASYGA